MNTWYERVVAAHTVTTLNDGEVLLYIPLHIMNEYTSPQAFSGLAAAGRTVRRPRAQLGVVDHVNSTRKNGAGSGDDAAALLLRTFAANCAQYGIRCLDEHHPDQGIEHVVVPELGLVRPGMVIACGDSHTTTYGAFGALGFGIGTSEVEHILATQTLVYRPLKPMRVTVDGELAPGVSAKDLILAVIARVGAGGANGYAVEFAGSAITALDLAGRMTVCNMAVEMGARAALIQPDAKARAWLASTLAILQEKRSRGGAKEGEDGLPAAPPEPELPGDAAVFEREEHFRAADIQPLVTWGTSPDQVLAVDEAIPDPALLPAARRSTVERALHVMGLRAGQTLRGLPIDMAFIGSCTNGRIEDLRAAAAVLAGRKVASGVRAIIVPGSNRVRQVAEAEGLDRIFVTAGCEWRPASGCSMCLAMNDDLAPPGTRVASATNRNFEGRQGPGARTHLMSPAMVAAAAVAGCISDVRSLQTMQAR